MLNSHKYGDIMFMTFYGMLLVGEIMFLFFDIDAGLILFIAGLWGITMLHLVRMEHRILMILINIKHQTGRIIKNG